MIKPLYHSNSMLILRGIYVGGIVHMVHLHKLPQIAVYKTITSKNYIPLKTNSDKLRQIGLQNTIPNSDTHDPSYLLV